VSIDDNLRDREAQARAEMEAMGYERSAPATDADQAQLRKDHPPPYKAVRVLCDGRVETLQRRALSDCGLRVQVRAVRPVTRRRGAGAPSRRRTSSASSSGSSDGPGEPAPGDPADLDPDVDVFVVVGEDHRQVALRLALVLALERGEIILSADAEVRDLVAEALPIVLSLLNRRGQTAAAAPTIFSDAWSIFVGEVTA